MRTMMVFLEAFFAAEESSESHERIYYSSIGCLPRF